MSAGVGKSFRMLQEARTLLKNGIDVKIGFIETHNRKETHELVGWFPLFQDENYFTKEKNWKKWMFKRS
jgi:two-component system sensor histidine kinase KdpD